MTIEEIIEKLQKARDAYYKTGETVMSDAEYDDLEDKLKELDPENPWFTSIGEDSIDGFPKAKHTILMGSQAKANTTEEVAAWLKKQKSKEFIVMHKYDGISLELNYAKGHLVSAITRGDGYIGDDVIGNAKKMKGVPENLRQAFTGAVRGEVLLFHSDKDKFYPEMKNCRNAASGIFKRLDGEGAEHLTLVVYDMQPADPNDIEYKMEKEPAKLAKMAALSTQFNVGEFKYVDPDAGKMMAAMNSFTMADKDFDTDGVVIKSVTVDHEDLRTSDRPKSQVAIKPARIEYKTKLVDIEWQVNANCITPVAVFEPVEMDGATCTRASMSNIAQIEEMGIEIGDEIWVSRRNCVIPHVERKA